jgi:transposase
MNKSNLLAIDLAKINFQVCQYKGNKQLKNQQVSREALLKLLATSKPSLVAMETCGGAHYFARVARSNGHEVMLLDARFVKAFRQGQKTDANDAMAIATASRAPSAHSCKVLSIEEQALRSLSHLRALADKQKLQLSNQVRGLLLEFGITIAQSEAAFRKAIPEILEDGESPLPVELKHAIALSYEHYRLQCQSKEKHHKQIEHIAKGNETCQRLMALEGVGPITAIELLTLLGNGEAFDKAKRAAACAGVTPRQHSSGGKAKIGHIPKRRGCSLRRNLFLGARSVVSKLKYKEPKTKKEQWIKSLLQRKSVKCVSIALANKTVRTAYAMLKKGTEYQPTLLAA